MASVMVRTKSVNLPGISLRKTAQVIPSGMVTASAMKIMMSVPTMAWMMPPTSIGSSGPALAMSEVKKLRCGRACHPRKTV